MNQANIVINTIKDAMQSLSATKEIPLTDLRIRISLNCKGLIYQIMSGKEVKGDSTLDEILGLEGDTMGQMTKSTVMSYLKVSLQDFKEDYEEEKKEKVEAIELRLFNKNDGTPSGYLFINNKPQREVKIEEIV